MKRLLALVLAMCMVLGALSFNVLAATELTSYEEINITKELGTAFADLELPEKVEFTTADEETVELDVFWDDSSYDPGVASQKVYGVPDTGDYEIDELFATITLTGEITEVAELDPITVAFGTAWADIELPEYAVGKIGESTVDVPLGNWIHNNYKADEAGTYTVKAKLLVPTGYSLAEGIDWALLSITVEEEVVDTDIEITAIAEFEDEFEVDAGTAADDIEFPTVYGVFADGTIKLSVTWASETYDAETSGEYTFTGTLGEAPDGYKYADALAKTVTATVKIENTAAYVTIDRFRNWEKTLTVLVGTSEAAVIAQLPEIYGYSYADSTVPDVKLETAWACKSYDADNKTWKDETYDANTQGTYRFYATLTAPTGYLLTANRVKTLASTACYVDVTVTDGLIQLNRIKSWTNTLSVTTGTSESSVIAKLPKIYAYNAADSTIGEKELTVSWACKSYNATTGTWTAETYKPDTAGTYRFYATLSTPSGYCLVTSNGNVTTLESTSVYVDVKVSAPATKISVSLRVEGSSQTRTKNKTYVPKTTASVNVNKANVYDAATGILSALGVSYKGDGSNVTQVFSTSYKSSTSTSGQKWCYFVNGIAYPSSSMADKELADGDEIILYYGVEGSSYYPSEITINGDSIDKLETIKESSTVTVAVEYVYKYYNAKTGKVVTESPSKLSISLLSVDEEGDYKKTGSFTYPSKSSTTYKAPDGGGKGTVSLYSYSNSNNNQVIRSDIEVTYVRSGSAAAYFTIIGPTKQFLAKTKSSAYTTPTVGELFEEFMDAKNYKYTTTTDSDGDSVIDTITIKSSLSAGIDDYDGAGWHLMVNDVYYGTKDWDQVPYNKNDDIVIYYGYDMPEYGTYTKSKGYDVDDNLGEYTVYPLVDISYDDDDGKTFYTGTSHAVRVYYIDDDGTTEVEIPITDLDLEFDGKEISKSTSSAGKATIPSVSSAGTYTLKVGAYGTTKKGITSVVYREVEIKATKKSGSSSSSGSGSSGGSSGSSSGTANTVYYTIKVKQNDGGSISPESATVAYGKSRQFAITPDKGYHVLDVEVDGESVGAVTSYTFSYVYANHTIEAFFEEGEAENHGNNGNGGNNGNNGNGGKKYGYGIYEDEDTVADWAIDYVVEAHNKKIMSGTGANFEPKRNITRAEFVTLVIRLLGYEDDVKDVDFGTAFDDVSKDDWFYSYVMAAYQLGLANGKGEGKFEPNAYLTREELATLVSRMVDLGIETDGIEYSDEAKISDWALSAVLKLGKQGIMVGSDGKFDPKSSVTREMAAIVATRVYNYMQK